MDFEYLLPLASPFHGGLVLSNGSQTFEMPRPSGRPHAICGGRAAAS